jgi:PilZ domain
MHFLPRLLVGDMNWQSLAIPAAGMVVTFLVLGAGFFWISKRKAKPSALDAVPSPDPFLQGPQSDRRQTPRRAGQAIKVSIQFANDQKTVFEGFVMDRSMGGLRLLLERPLATNQMLNVRSTDAPQSVTWVQVQVRRSYQLPDKSYEVGCQFIRTPPWAVLLTFG